MTDSLFVSILLGIIQGASEFLPISSSGHLIIAPEIFGFKDPGLAFDVALHFGTLIAVVAFFYRDWMEIFRSAWRKIVCKKERKMSFDSGLHNNMLFFLIVATVPGVLAGLFLEEIAETLFRNPYLVAFNLFFWGLVLLLADKYSARRRVLKNVNVRDGIIVGLAQALAIVPGTSRSGITISAGMARGLTRRAAARFSFLMLTPIAIGASVLKADELIFNFNVAVLMGIIFSAVSGYLAIKYLLKFVEKVSYQIFFWYRLILAIVILLVV